MTVEIDGWNLFVNLFEDGLFSQILEEDRDDIVEGLTKKSIAKGKPLCNGSKDINEHTFVIESGELELYFDDPDTGEKRVLRNIKGHEIIYSIFSITDMLTGRERFAPVKASTLKDSVVYCLPNKKLVELAKKDSSFAFLLLRNTVSYAQKITNIIYSISGKKFEEWKRSELMQYVCIYEANATGILCRDHIQNTDGILAWGMRNDTEQTVSMQPFSWKEGRYDMMVNAFYSASATNSSAHKFYDYTNDTSLADIHPDACDKLMRVLQMKGQHHKEILMKYLRVYKLVANREIKGADDETNHICFVVDGTVKRISAKGNVLETVSQSTLLGVYSVITGESVQYGIKAGDSGCTVALLRRKDINQLRRENFHIVAHFCDYKIRQLSRAVRLVDFAISMESIKSGDAIERDEVSLLYITMGRLRKKIDPHVTSISDYTNRYRKDFGRGSMIGYDDILYKRKNDQILYAVRDSQVARIPLAVFEYFMEKYPKAFFQKQRQLLYDNSRGKTSADISTVACVAVSADVPLDPCMEVLREAMVEHGRSVKIRHEKDISQEDPESDSILRTENLKRVMNSLKQKGTIDVYVANFPYNDEWSKVVIEQADVILVFGVFQNGYNDDDNHKILREKQNEYSPEEILVLLHKPKEGETYDNPKDTWKWLRDERIYKTSNQETRKDLRKHQISHLHIRCPDKMFREPGQEASHTVLKDFTFKDFPRLVRYLLGQSYGLVLGGGGARGFAHVGVIDKMTKAEIPIDKVGGTSMGSFVGATYCMSTDVKLLERNAETFRDWMGSWHKIFTFNIPYISLTSGCYFNDILKNIFGEIDFEDLWIPYFNVTTDITESEKVVNTKGPLWQYVRASMSLAGIVPPLCDPYNENYLLDGGSVDNLPAREMKQRGCNKVVAIDVGGKIQADELKYGDCIRSWELFYQKLNPWNTKVVPDLLTVVTKLACISGDEELKRVQNSKDFIYERPEGINEYGTLEFSKYSEIKSLGENAGDEVIKKWKASD